MFLSQRGRRVLAWSNLAVVLALTGGCGSFGRFSPLRPFETSVVFQPAKYPAGDWAPTDLPIEDARFDSEDGVKLHG